MQQTTRSFFGVPWGCRQTLTASESGTLAGKVQFFDQSCSGCVGRAVTKPLYGRQHSVRPNSKLTISLTASLSMIKVLARDARPKTIPLLQRQGCVPLIYADAFFVQGQTRLSVRDFESAPHYWPADEAHTFGRPCYFCGRVPSEVLARFAHRRQYLLP